MRADSKCPKGNRLSTMSLVFPRYILAELNTHRMLSKNSASSRAIPFNRMVQIVKDDPFVPIAWQKEHKGMQGTEYITDPNHIRLIEAAHLTARDAAVKIASEMNVGLYPDRNFNVDVVREAEPVTKQLCNRYLEPFMWHRVLISGTEWENFFELRCPQYEYFLIDRTYKFRSRKDMKAAFADSAIVSDELENWSELDWLQANKGQAEIHMMALAEATWDCMNESTPKELKEGEWHIPYGDTLNYEYLGTASAQYYMDNPQEIVDTNKWAVKVATAIAARESYSTIEEGKTMSYERLIELHDRMATAVPMHCFDSTTEVLTDRGWKLFPQVTYNDVIIQVSPKTGEVKGASKPTNIIAQDYNGKVYHYDSKNIDLFITEGHKLIGVPVNKYTDRAKSYESIEVFRANRERDSVFTTAHLKYKTYGEQELRMFSAPKPKAVNTKGQAYLQGCLAGFFIGDGHKPSEGFVKFRLKRDRKIKFLTNLLSDLGMDSVVKSRDKGVTEFHLKDEGVLSTFYDNNKEKTIPAIFMNEELLYGLFEGLKQSDGFVKRNTWGYDTTSKSLHDRILELCPVVGLTGYSNPSYPLQELRGNRKPMYRIAFTTTNRIIVNDSRTPESRVITKHFTGKVYCVEVPEHGIIVRRNGKTCITHNCSPFEHCAQVMGSQEYKDSIRGKHEGEKTFNYEYSFDESSEGWCRNYRGFRQYRDILEKGGKQ